MAGFSRFTPLVQSLPATIPFVGPEAQERKSGKAFRARIGANENGFGPAPSVQKRISETAGDVWKYADPENFDLRAALADHLGLTPDRIVVDGGVDTLLGLAVRQVVSEGTPVVSSLGAYPTFNYHVAGFGGRLVTVPYLNDREDPEALLAAVKREDAAIVYMSNPDNPMGTWRDAETILAFAKALPENTLFVLDEAYGEMAPEGALPPADAFLDRPNVVRMRTFSKAYGLAGMRCGYAFGHPDTIASFDKVRNHFGMNILTQIAALEALRDQTYLAEVLTRIEASKDRISAIARANGLEPLPSATNFVAIDCGRDGAFATAVLAALVERGVFVRMPGVEPLNRCIRISAAPDADIDILEEELPKAVAAAS